jgi:hypothetical protein
MSQRLRVCSIELGTPANMVYTFEISVISQVHLNYISYTATVITTSGLTAAILNFQTKQLSWRPGLYSSVKYKAENMDLAVRISLLSHTQPNLLAHPV